MHAGPALLSPLCALLPSPMPPNDFPSLKAKQLLAVLLREPLGYVITRRTGSHRTLKAEGRPTIRFAFHDKVTVRPRLVRKILVDDVGLDEDEARDLL